MIRLFKLFVIFQFHCLWYLTFNFVWIDFVESFCPPFISTNNLSFQIEPNPVISNVDGRYTSLHCCITGYRELLWYFRKMNDNDWIMKKVGVQFDEGNRTLDILRPTTYIDTGFYLCQAYDGYGNNISRTVFVYFLNVDQRKDIQQKDQQRMQKTNFRPGEDANFTCSGLTYEPRYPVFVTWWHNRSGVIKPISKTQDINTTLNTARDRIGETNPDLVIVVSVLTLLNVKMADEGYYICRMAQNGSQFEEIFLLSITDDRINIIILITCIVVTLAIFGSITLIWVYHDNVIVIYKSYLDPCPGGHKRMRDVSILYEDMDEESMMASVTIAQNLEKCGFSCWFYDRDKEFGRDKTDEYSQAMNQSHILLILLTSHSARLLTSLASLSPDPRVRRLYVFVPNRRAIYSLPMIRDTGIITWMKNELKLQKILQRNSINLDYSKADNAKYLKIYTWIISSLPSIAIREARDRLTD